MEAAIEAILFVSVDPVPAARLSDLLGIDEEAAHAAVARYEAACREHRRGVRVVSVAGGYQLRTAPELADVVGQAIQSRPPALSAPALETLAVIAYKQPITRADIESIRGVRADHSLTTLTAYGLIKAVGRHASPGRPILYGTTQEFLEWCGLMSLDRLPRVVDDDTDFA